MKRTIALLFCLLFFSLSYTVIAQEEEDDSQLESLEYLKEVYHKNPKTPNINFFLGRAYLLNNDFDNATEQFKTYLTQKINAKQKADAERLLENCANGKALFANPVNAKIENLGNVVNSKFNEYVPVISSDESVLIFTYRGDKSVGGLQDFYNNPDPKGFYYEDIMMSTKVDGNWTTPVSLGDNINGKGHDACIALSSDGQKLFVYKNGPKDGGDIYISKLEGSSWSAPERLLGEVNSQYWEGSASLSADEKTLYFSSERPGGYGGRDIYTAKIKADGTWGRIENMGPNINTPYDDDAPFIHSSGVIFIYSSKGWNSMGGYDIFVSTFENGQWTKAENLGVPINTTDDDSYYVLSADAKRGYYSTGKVGGFGQNDIYMVEPGLPGNKTALELLSGVVMVDDKPVAANIIVGYTNNDEIQGDYTSNATTGKYLVNLPAGKSYKLIYVVDGFDDQIKTVDATGLTTFLENKIDIKLYSAGKKPAEEAVVTKIASPPPVKEVVEEATSEAKKAATNATDGTLPSLTKPIADYSYNEMIQQLGSVKLDGASFYVQIGAYKQAENFRYTRLTSLGNVKKEIGSDGITRFTQGSFSTLKAAEAHRKKVASKGGTDAFVTVIYQGQRISLRDLYAKTLTQK